MLPANGQLITVELAGILPNPSPPRFSRSRASGGKVARPPDLLLAARGQVRRGEGIAAIPVARPFVAGQAHRARRAGIEDLPDRRTLGIDRPDRDADQQSASPGTFIWPPREIVSIRPPMPPKVMVHASGSGANPSKSPRYLLPLRHLPEVNGESVTSDFSRLTKTKTRRVRHDGLEIALQ